MILFQSDAEKVTSVPIIKTGPTQYVRVYTVFVSNLVVGDHPLIVGTVSATNPYAYNAMFGVTIRRHRQEDMWMTGGVEVARPHVLNITPSMHHYAFPVMRFDTIGDGEVGDWYYHFVCYSAASGATSGAKMTIDPYGCLQVVVIS